MVAYTLGQIAASLRKPPKADDLKTNLVSTVSHELKTPLTSVRMALHLLLEESIGALNAKQTCFRDSSEWI